MSDRLNRRSFLQTAAALTAAAAVHPALARPEAKTAHAIPYPENGTLIPDEGWRLWLDREAKWAEDDIFLPEEVRWVDGVLQGGGRELPVNAPTGGWGVLDAGKNVVLPTTVEQHFWGVAGTRPYTPEEYRYAAPAKGAVPPADDNVPRNGAYVGVSWWTHEIEVPAAMRGKRIFLHVRGARLRAEVYLNRKLVGYSIMEELPFDCDLTTAAEPGGRNLLAIRITNPFGRFDWVDGLNARWGKVALYRSHGFGGLDRGMTISVHDGARIVDAWVLNGSHRRDLQIEPYRALEVSAVIELPDVTVDAAVAKATAEGLSSNLSLAILDPEGGEISCNPQCLSAQFQEGRLHCSFEIFAHGATLWDLDHPKIYHLRFQWHSTGRTDDVRIVPFGFRTFAVQGLGSNAMFRLNDRRLKIYTSISWGFWGLNGLFPVPELAEKEVTQAKKLGLNCLNFHRNLAKEEVLRAQDRLGLLRHLEPGGGKLAIGKLPANVQANAAGIVMEKATSAADKFAQRYMFVKCVAMVRAFRSHPSVVEYCLQNEIGADLKNSDTIAVLEAMRKEDPSRCIVLNDGFVAPPRKAAQAWFEPWNPKLHRSDEEEWGGWWNQHQGAGDQWYDEFYKSPGEFTYKSLVRAQLSEFGEMEGCATPDNHSLTLHQIAETYKRYGGTSYDTIDHQEIVIATDRFLDKWGFRKAFPVTEQLWNALGRKCYETWQNYLENARISDELDYAAISGWESTAIENHSGIVDNLRNFKSDPAPITQTLQRVHPVAKQRSLCVRLGESAVFDLFLLNDTGTAATGTLTFWMITPGGKKVDLKTIPTPRQTADVFSYLLQEGFATPKLNEEGLYRFKFAISSVPGGTQTKELWVTTPDAAGQECKSLRVAVSGVSPKLRRQLEALGCASVSDFKAGETYGLIVSSGLTSHSSTEQNIGETTGLETVPPVVNPGHKPEPGEEAATQQLGRLQPGILEAVKAGTPLLAIPQANTLSDGVAKQLAEAGAFTFAGNVGDFRAPWMGNWYFVREHALFAGMPVNQVLGGFYQAKGRQSNGLLVDGPGVEVIVGYSRDHDRKLGAGTFTAQLGKGKVVYHRTPEFHPVLQQRFLANALRWLTTQA